MSALGHQLPRSRELRSRTCAGTLSVARGADRNGMGTQIARRDLRADQGSEAEWRQNDGGACPSHGRGFARGMGLESRRGAPACTRHTRRVRRLGRRLDRERGGVSPALKEGCRAWRRQSLRATFRRHLSPLASANARPCLTCRREGDNIIITQPGSDSLGDLPTGCEPRAWRIYERRGATTPASSLSLACRRP
jgi:hypothetical protein